MSISSMSGTGSSYVQMQPTQDASAMQTSLMQALSGLFAALAPFFQAAAQNTGFASNPSSATIGNSLSGGQPMTADRATQVVNKNFDNIKGADGFVDRGDLQKALNNPDSSAELKQAASFLLNDDAAMRKLETADVASQGRFSPADGRISKGDTAAAMANSAQTPAERNAVATLLEHKDGLMGGDGLISKEELATIAAGGPMPNGKQAPADLQQAAQFLTQNPEIFNKLENANFYGNPGSTTNKSDGKVGLQDMLTTLSK